MIYTPYASTPYYRMLNGRLTRHAGRAITSVILRCRMLVIIEMAGAYFVIDGQPLLVNDYGDIIAAGRLRFIAVTRRMPPQEQAATLRHTLRHYYDYAETHAITLMFITIRHITCQSRSPSSPPLVEHYLRLPSHMVAITLRRLYDDDAKVTLIS